MFEATLFSDLKGESQVYEFLDDVFEGWGRLIDQEDYEIFPFLLFSHPKWVP